MYIIAKLSLRYPNGNS